MSNAVGLNASADSSPSHSGETLRSLGKPARDEPQRERILLRVFCHAHGDGLILLLGGYDKGANPSKRGQQREIAEARRRLADFRRRTAGRDMGYDPY